jgi:hypothetical protein
MKDNTFAVYVLATPRARNDERTDRVGSQSRWYGARSRNAGARPHAELRTARAFIVTLGAGSAFGPLQRATREGHLDHCHALCV